MLTWWIGSKQNYLVSFTEAITAATVTTMRTTEPKMWRRPLRSFDISTKLQIGMSNFWCKKIALYMLLKKIKKKKIFFLLTTHERLTLQKFIKCWWWRWWRLCCNGDTFNRYHWYSSVFFPFLLTAHIAC